MPASADIYGQIQPFKAPNPLADMAQAMQIQHAMGANALNDYTLRSTRRKDEETNALASAIKGGLDLSTPDGQRQAYGVAPTVADAYIKAQVDRQKAQADIGKTTAETGKFKVDTHAKQVELSGQYFGALRANPTPENFASTMDALQNNGIMPAEMVAQIKAKAAADPTSIATMAEQGFRAALSAKDQLAKFEKVDTGGGVQVGGVDPVTAKFTPTATLAKTQTPDSVASNATSVANNKRTIAAENMRAGVNADGSPADGGGLLSPESVANAAARYNMDGTLPPNLGRGTQGPRQTAQILNEAARMAAANGNGPEAQRIAQLANKSSAQALNTLEKQQTMVGAFEKNFNKNADIALEMSQKVGRTGVPILNSWLNAGKRAVAGDPDLAAFDANIKATVNEYAKIVGGGTGGGATAQGEITKIEGLLSAAQTPQQVQAVITLMKRETANRMSAFEDQKTELKRGMIQQKPAAPAAAAPSTPTASGTAPAGWTYIGTTK